MEKRVTYTVKEFDWLVSEKDSKFFSGDSSKITVMSNSDFQELSDYLLSSVKEEGKQLFEARRKGQSHYIRMKNYVGMIELPRSKNRVEIMPKIYSGSNEVSNIEKIKNILLQMLSSLKDFPSLETGTSFVDLKKLNLYEIFIRIFFERVLELVKLGLRSGYEEVSENSNVFRGKLHVSMHIKHNLAHQERFYVSYDKYTLSRPENRILKSAIVKLLKATDDPQNAFLARRAMIFFDEIPESTDFEADYRRISFDNSNRGYLSVIQWAMVFLRNRSFSIFGGSTNGQSLLFPMDRIFEQYIAKQIARLVRLHNKQYGTTYRFISQEKKRYLFDVPKSFYLTPDLKVEGEDNILLDTKWKLLSDAKEKNHNNISQSDMYQMYAYSKRYSATNVFLLYPETDRSQFITEREYVANDALTTKVSIRFLDLGNIVDNSRSAKLSNPDSLYSILSEFMEKTPGAGKTIANV